jgi:diguanylate cyclase (GGDEF)-like protein
VGLALAAVAIWRGSWLAFVAGMGGAAVAIGWTIRWRPGRLRRRGPPPLQFREILDLLRRAHLGKGAWGIASVEGTFEVPGSDQLSEAVRRRGAAVVQLASIDGRPHVVNEPEGIYVAVGDFPYGVALLIGRYPGDDVISELRRFVAGMRFAEEQAAAPRGGGRILAARLSRAAAGGQTLDGVARAGVELAEQIAQRGAVLALAADDSARIVAVSGKGDRRLLGHTLTPDAPVARAIGTGVPIATTGSEDVFGSGVPERRRAERAGTAYPVLDGSIVVGALVLVGPPLDPDIGVMEDLGPLVAELGPRIAAARAVHDAERRALLDPLTGLRNRAEFQRVLEVYHAQKQPPAATLVYVDLDYFKRLNDTLGHPAGDAALKHIARLLESAVRDGDLVARIGGEEFAVWLPHAGEREGLEIAERIRSSVANAAWHWSGKPWGLTTSCGVAAFPQPIGSLLNLPAAADAALYRAKQGGRNRVEKAPATD